MNPGNSLIRPLNPIEQAFTISNAAAPLVVVSILHLRSGPLIGNLRSALNDLQRRHQLLQAGIAEVNGRLSFRKLLPAPLIPLEIIERHTAGDWKTVAEEALNTSFPIEGPLLRCWYLPAYREAECELIICFHHAIIDGASARLILHELLSLCSGMPLASPSLAVRHTFPAAYRKIRLWQKIVRFAGRQLAAEWRYKNGGLTSAAPPSSRNATISLRLNPALSRKLSVRIGRQGLSLNGVLLAAMTQAVIRYKHPAADQSSVRAISFVDLRDTMQPVVPSDALGCHVSMLRLDVPWNASSDLIGLAANLRRAIFKAIRQGEPILMSIMSRYLVQMVFRLQNTRLGVSALSFIGPLELQRTYGAIQVDDVRAFITNNRFGPYFSAFGKTLFGAIGLDFTYLSSEIDEETAALIVADIKISLEKLADLS